MRITITVIVSLFFSTAAFSDAPVKKSNSGLCHPPESNWYNRTESFIAFDNVEACLETGGRLPEGISLGKESGPPSSDQYERSAFGHGWDDANGDCQDSRAKALIATSTTPVRFATERGCRAVTGRWISPFTGNVIQNASDIDIDHVVPLAWAWPRGASDWTRDRRIEFANDLINLWPVEASLNRSKGARGPDDWLPPSGQCGYVARFVRINRTYDLKPAEAEALWIQSFLEECRH